MPAFSLSGFQEVVVNSKRVIEEIIKMATAPVSAQGSPLQRIRRQPVLMLGSLAFSNAVEALLEEMQEASKDTDDNKFQAVSVDAEVHGVITFRCKAITNLGFIGKALDSGHDNASVILVTLRRNKMMDKWGAERTV